ncbi:hypothetical protein GCM10010172_84750 [Paractinoplanes ferrugineus]|uniref:Uncharacterized protein n=1 Tax=Paractinoplanes ferrugineus TaxID=113564 RepID=A0A919MHQ9_9ACTN|nr:hypothetical protein [Actinoplanes ferrugineus]GIE15214.1 hypothetical protein Afe05nite_70540 [Actinoplanes ferrugineus]
MPDAVRLVDHLDRLVTGLLIGARVDAGTQAPELTPPRLDPLTTDTASDGSTTAT